uniref:30S ribosomal protein S15 n=1 Tax=Phaeomonas parva TaxID=124430 RepID=A0A7S1XRX6_9STRA|mmetsp:Transcript_33300/g.105275  ORF Transcript_33300/g.105275 Transcript_33300/m.105275 type:complete len:215 (+) Transcript_33300:200-844(+)
MFRAVQIAALVGAASGFVAPRAGLAARGIMTLAATEEATSEPAKAPADPLAGLPDGLDIDGLFGEDLEMLSPLEDEPEELFTAEEIAAMEPVDDGKGEVSDAPPGWWSNKQAINAATEKFKKHEKDTGSAEFQIAKLSARITYMTEHAKRHPKDHHSRRGLITMVNKRRRLLNYLNKTDPEAVERITSELGIRFKAAGRIMTRAERYAAFKPRK